MLLRCLLLVICIVFLPAADLPQPRIPTQPSEQDLRSVQEALTGTRPPAPVATQVDPVQPETGGDLSGTASDDGKARNPYAADTSGDRSSVDEADALGLDWLDRRIVLPRLGQALTEGRIAPRGIDATYRIQAGDRLRVVTWGGTALNEIVPVDASGSVALPGFGAVPVAGATLPEAQAALTELARSHFKQAGVLVGVDQAGAVAATVVGEVVDPGYHSLPAGASVLDALAAAQGVLRSGSLRSIVLRAPGQDDLRVDLYRIAVDGAADQLRALPPGTMVFVPVRGPEVQVFGAVQRSVAVELLPGEALSEAIRLSGGLRGDGDAQVIRLLRESDQGQTLRQVDLATLATLPAQAGDRLLVVPRAELAQQRAAIRVTGSVRSPGVYAWEPGLTVDQIIAYAGGALPDADLAKALVRRQHAQAQTMTVGDGIDVPSLFEIIGPVSGSVVLQALDELVVPAFPPLADSDLAIEVRGAVLHPGKQPITPGLTVQQALLLAGGLSADAQVDAADLVRTSIDADGNRSVTRMAVDLRRIIAGEPGPLLYARDEIVVRVRNDRRMSVTVQGAIRNSGTFALAQGATVAEVIALAGGLNDDAFVHGIRLYRPSEVAAAQEYIERLKQQLEAAVAVNQRTLMSGGSGDERDVQALQVTIAQQEAEITKLAKARATGRLLGVDFPGMLIDQRQEADVVLHNGDVIDIPVRPGTLRVFGEVMNPGSLRHEQGLHVPTLIARSGGYTQQADRKRVFVIRADGAVVATAAGRGVAWDGAKRGWIATSIDSLDLQEGDTVIVPPDLEFKAGKLNIAKDLTTILFQIAVAAATVVAVAG